MGAGVARKRQEATVADGGIPNKHRADSALTIYRDAMRQYIAPILEREHGPNWIRSQELSPSAAQQRRALESGSPLHSLIDFADISFLIERNSSAFPTLGGTDVDLTHAIRKLRNDIYHSQREGDCTRGEADAVAALCGLVLERCGLSDAAENIRNLPSATAASAVSDADQQNERARREWDKERISKKPDEERTLLERQRFAEIALEEEWEAELERREQERLEQEHRERERREREWRERERRAQELGKRLSAGGYHSLGLREDGTVVAWGDNDDGQCDAPAEKFVAVSASRVEIGYSLGLREDGTVVAWGDNGAGQCDAPAEKFVAVSAGGCHSLGLREDGTVVAWGDNGDGQCDAPAEKFVAVSAGWGHSLGLREDGTVVAWGYNDAGECDAPAEKFVAVSAGAADLGHNLGLREDGTVVAWGDNGAGECDAPAGKFAAVSAGYSYSLGLREDGTVVAWGGNGAGECDAPAEKFVAVSAGWGHSLGLREDGTVVAWGSNYYGRCDVPRDLRIR